MKKEIVVSGDGVEPPFHPISLGWLHPAKFPPN